MKFLILATILFSLFLGCSRTNDEKLLNDRISVLEYASDLLISANLNINEINPAPSKNINYWSQSGQNPQNNLPNLYTKSFFENKSKIISDKGSSTNTIQPIFFENNLCSVSTKGILSCYSVSDKKLVWELNIKVFDDDDYEIMRGGLAYFDNQIILADGYGQIKSINSLNGSIIWEKNISIPIFSAPIIYRDYIYFTTLNNRIYALDLLSGEIKWDFQTIFDDKKSLFTASPAAVQNLIIAPFSNGEIVALINDSGDIVWTENASNISSLSNFDIKDIAANPVISDDKVFTLSNNGRILATNLIDGSKAWSLEISGSNSPIVSNLQLYVLDNESRLICINKNSGEIYWITKLEKRKGGSKKGKLNYWKGPYLINDIINLISIHGELIQILPLNGDFLSTKNINISGITIDPVITSNGMFILDSDSNIYKVD